MTHRCTTDAKAAVDVDAWLARCQSADFDGHSPFDRLSPTERLQWLGLAAQAVRELKALAQRARRQPADPATSP